MILGNSLWGIARELTITTIKWFRYWWWSLCQLCETGKWNTSLSSKLKFELGYTEKAFNDWYDYHFRYWWKSSNRKDFISACFPLNFKFTDFENCFKVSFLGWHLNFSSIMESYFFVMTVQSPPRWTITLAGYSVIGGNQELQYSPTTWHNDTQVQVIQVTNQLIILFQNDNE